MTRLTAIMLSVGVLWMAGTDSLWAAEPRYGGTYRFPLSTDPPTLDPAHITDTTSHTVASEMFNGLVQYDDKLNIVPDIAERWDLSSDKRTTYTAICASRWLRAMRHVWCSPIISALTLLGRGAPASSGVGSRIQL